MVRRLFIILFSAGLPLAVWSQSADSTFEARRQEVMRQWMVSDSVEITPTDTIPVFSLDTIVLLPDLYFSRMSDYYKYRVLWRKTVKVYPLAKKMGEDLQKLDERLSRMTPAQRRHYKRIVERYVRKVIEPQLHELTVTEGRVLIKLVHRQTGMTVYEFLKKYKSGLSAVWWQSLAKIYKIDLKMRYEPAKSKDDFWMEDILQRAFSEGILDRTPSKVPVDYYKLFPRFMEKMPERYRHPERFAPKRKIFPSLRRIDSVQKARQRRAGTSANP